MAFVPDTSNLIFDSLFIVLSDAEAYRVGTACYQQSLLIRQVVVIDAIDSTNSRFE